MSVTLSIYNNINNLCSKSQLYFDTDGLAWDWIGGNLYWTDYCQDDIEVYNPLSGYQSVIFNSGLIKPHAIVADPTTR